MVNCITHAPSLDYITTLSMVTCMMIMLWKKTCCAIFVVLLCKNLTDLILDGVKWLIKMRMVIFLCVTILPTCLMYSVWNRTCKLIFGRYFESHSTGRNQTCQEANLCNYSNSCHWQVLFTTTPIERYWNLDFSCTKQSPYVKLVNIREGEEHNGVICFVKELLIFAKFINSNDAL